MQLNPQQTKAVLHVSSPLLVLAGAGSGKTGVITHKIAHLVQQLDTSPDRIFAVTFTNKAATEMKTRLRGMLGASISEQLSVSTFHTLGLRMLRQEGQALGFNRNLTILDATDSTATLKALASDAKLTTILDAQQARFTLSRWKNDGLTPNDIESQGQSLADAEISQLYQLYQDHLRQCNAVDFDDLLTLPVALLQDDERRHRWQAKVRHLLVDEYQDTNSVQYQLVLQLTGAHGRLTAVGDDDQSVYAWRGARPENLARLNADFPQLTVIKLEQNYRSTQPILKTANELISNNPHTLKKSLWSQRTGGDAVRIMHCATGEDEADWVAADLHAHQYRSRGVWSQYAVLYRGNFQSRAFERALREKRIPYIVSGGASFFDRAEIKDVVAYLRLFVNRKDDAAFLRVINTPRRDIGPATLRKLSSYAGQARTSLLDACFELGIESALGPAALNRINRFAKWYSTWQERIELEAAANAVPKMLEELNFQSWLQESSERKDIGNRRWQNVEELISWIENAAPPAGSETLTLRDAVAHLSLLDRLENEDETGNAVRLMTLHASKGLEFPFVYVTGFEEDLLPHHNSIEEGNIEEERRLCYVGITRAQSKLTLTRAKKRNRFGNTNRTTASRFLAELPASELEIFGDKATEETVTEQRGKEALADLRAMLGKR